MSKKLTYSLIFKHIFVKSSFLDLYIDIILSFHFFMPCNPNTNPNLNHKNVTQDPNM